MEFLSVYWAEILPVVLFVLGLFVLAKIGAKKQVKEILFYLVTRAEQEFGNGTGELKYASVVTWLYERLPAVCRFVLSENQLDTLIEEAVDRMQEYLSSNTAAAECVAK